MKALFILSLAAAISFTEATLAQTPAERALTEAVAARGADDLQTAARKLDGVLATDPKNFRANYERGLVYLSSGDDEKAIVSLEAAEAAMSGESTPDFTIYNSLGWAYLQAGRYADAQTEFDKGLAHRQELPSSAQQSLLNNLATLYMATGQIDKAEAPLRDAAAQGSKRAAINLRSLPRK